MPVMVYNKQYASTVESYEQLKQISDNYVVTEENAGVAKVFDFDPSGMFP